MQYKEKQTTFSIQRQSDMTVAPQLNHVQMEKANKSAFLMTSIPPCSDLIM